MRIHWGELQNLPMALQFYLMRHVEARQGEVLWHAHVEVRQGEVLWHTHVTCQLGVSIRKRVEAKPADAKQSPPRVQC